MNEEDNRYHHIGGVDGRNKAAINRITTVFLLITVLAVVGMVVGLTVLVQSPVESSSDDNSLDIIASHNQTSSPTSIPTSYPTASPAPTLRPTFAPTARAWLQVGSDIDGPSAEDEFGFSVSLSKDGNRLAVGAPNHDRDGSSNSGLVQVFEKGSGGNWAKIGWDILGESFGDWFGASVSMSDNGERLAVGAPGHDGERGQMKVFQLGEVGMWELVGNPLLGEAESDGFGNPVSLSMDGNIVAVGARENDGVNGEDSGHVRVFRFASGSWTQLGGDIDGELYRDRSGGAVSLSADGLIVAIGAPWNDNVFVQSGFVGHVRVFMYGSNRWNQVGQDIDGEDARDNSGWAVSLSSNGKVIAIGAPLNGFYDSGHVRLYRYDEGRGEWLQLGNDIDGEAKGDQSGYTVSLSSDGTVVAIGAEYNDGNGSDSGHVRIFQFDGNDWVQVGADIDGEAAKDEFGFSVSLSGDGRSVAIGGPYNDANGYSSGHVRVFEWPLLG